MKVTFREQALADLAGIAEYHAAHGNPLLAAAVIHEIHRAIYSRAHPALARAARYDEETNNYEIVLPRLPYIVLYRPTDTSLDIIGVFHTARHPDQKRG